MSREIVLVFATHYPSPGFNCTEVADATDKRKGKGCFLDDSLELRFIASYNTFSTLQLYLLSPHNPLLRT